MCSINPSTAKANTSENPAWVTADASGANAYTAYSAINATPPTIENGNKAFMRRSRK